MVPESRTVMEPQMIQQPHTIYETHSRSVQVPRTVMEDHVVTTQHPKIEMTQNTIQVSAQATLVLWWLNFERAL